MARFITEKEQKSVTQSSSSYLHYLLLIIIVMEFIRLPDVLGLPPVYFVTALCLFAIVLFDLNKLSTISPLIIAAIFALLFYNIYLFLLFWGVDIQNEKPLSGARQLGIAIKKTIQLVLFSIACTNFLELKRITFTITITIFISAAFGLLTYYFGGPFEEFRAWLWQSRAETLTVEIVGKGSVGQFVIGLSGSHWLFGYLIAAGPSLALVCWQLSRFKRLWVGIFLLMCYALYLNGQRAAFVPGCFMAIALLLYWRLVRLPIASIVAAFVLSIYIYSFGNIQVAQIYHSSNEELTFIDRLQHSGHDSENRFGWWKAGLMSGLESPWTGATMQEYVGSFFGRESVVVNNPDRKIPFAHNSYINPGALMGVAGWIIMLAYLFVLKKLITQVFTAATDDKPEKILFQGASVIVLAPMLNAMFQNDSIFSGEPANVCLTGLLISCYQLAYKQGILQSNYRHFNNKHA